MAVKNRMGRSRKPGDPYIVLEDHRLPGWRWEVLKTWQADGMKPEARAFCLVTSPMTGSLGDMGDVWITELGTQLVDYDRAVFTDAADALGALFGTGVPGWGEER